MTRHNFASGILLALSPYVKLASHRLRGKSLTNEANTSLCHLSRIKSVSDIRNIGFQFAGIMVSCIKNIQRKCMNKKIVELRNKLGLSRASFARALDISPSQMARIEAGKVVLSDEFLKKICSTFHVNPAFFTGEMDIDEAVKVVSLEEEMKQVGKRLKQARSEKGLTLKELSDLVGLSDSQLCLIENGTNKLAEKRAANIGEALEVGVEWLLHGKERNKAFPADRKMMEWLKDHPEIREQIWKMMEN